MTDVPARLSSALADRYLIERELGAGGMATVYLAQDLRHDRKVALKVLRPELAAILGGERFLAEIKTTANLQHPHILSLFDSGDADGLVYYVMPYVEGESLRERLSRERQLPVDDAVRIAREVADALEYAHEHGIVHRDIKPENILLHGGHALVADFGIALAASRGEGGTRMTETGMSLGTPHYMAPEQAMGEKEITPKADIYALGCVLYEMLTAEPPFMGATAQAIIARVMTEEPRSLTLQRKSIPPHVEAAVRMALEKLPADRFATAAQFGEALGRTDFTLAATRATPAARGVSTRSRLRTGAPWVLFAVAGIAAVAGWLHKPTPVPSIRYRIALTSGAIAPGLVGRDFALSPDGRTIVFSDTTGGKRQLWIKTADREEAEPLTGTTGGRGPSFSPDGEWLAFSAEGQIRKVPRLGGSAVTIADSANMNVPFTAWLDDGTVLYSEGNFRLRAVGQDGGAVRSFGVLDSARPFVASASGLPGGRVALATACNGGCTDIRLLAVDLKSGTARSLGDDIVHGWAVAGGRVVTARRDGGVFVAPFDPGALRFSSPPVPVLNGVRTRATYADMVVSFDGTLLFVPGDAQAAGISLEVVRVARDGRAAPVDSGWTFARTANGGIALSPDGRRLAVAISASGASDIWIKELDHGAFTRLTFLGTNARPEWSADGRYVMYSSGDSGRAVVRRRRADGTGGPETLVHVGRSIYEIRRTRDTMELLVRPTGPPSRDIFLYDRRDSARGDSAMTPLMAHPAHQENAVALSPDGRWLAYASNESGRFEVYVRPFPDVNSGRWQISRDGGNEPLWAHSGRELFFVDGSGHLVAVRVQAGTAFTPGQQDVLFDASQFLADVAHTPYDIAPDDRHFYFVRTVGQTATGPQATTAVLVQHWLTGLGQRPAGQ